MNILKKLQIKWIQLTCKHQWISPYTDNWRERVRFCTKCNKKIYPFKNIHGL